MKRIIAIMILLFGLAVGMNAQTITDFTPGTAINAAAMNANFDNIIAEFNILKARIAELEDDFPLGTVIASFIEPSGQYMTGSSEWALADGSNPDTSSYSGLFPDMSGRFLRGMDVNADMDPDARTIGSLQADAFQGHIHNLILWANSTGTTPSIQVPNGAPVAQSLVMQSIVNDGTNGTPRTAAETRPANVAVYWYIKVK